MACPDPPAIARGIFTFINSTTVQFTCLDGYSLQGYSLVSCISGQWNNSEIPMCLVSWPVATDILTTRSPYEEYKNNGVVLEDWMYYVFMALGGSLILILFLTVLLCLCHLLGYFDGPLVGFGGKYVYSDRHLCCCCSCDGFINVCCSCRCRACRKNKKKKTPRVEDNNVPLTEVKIQVETQPQKTKKISLMKPFKSKRKKRPPPKKSNSDTIPLKELKTEPNPKMNKKETKLTAKQTQKKTSRNMSKVKPK